MRRCHRGIPAKVCSERLVLKRVCPDAVFGVRSSLITKWEQHPPGPAPDGTRSDFPFHTLKFDFVLNKGAA